MKSSRASRLESGGRRGARGHFAATHRRFTPGQHAMISTGAGFAAGNKNACLAIGNPVGWEILDLGNLVVWGSGGGATTRNVQVRYRELK
jgi:hypothetical protein